MAEKGVGTDGLFGQLLEEFFGYGLGLHQISPYNVERHTGSAGAFSR